MQIVDDTYYKYSRFFWSVHYPPLPNISPVSIPCSCHFVVVADIDQRENRPLKPVPTCSDIYELLRRDSRERTSGKYIPKQFWQ